MDEVLGIPTLNKEEIRVLGALIEKSKTTPENYPLTSNALLLACNQKTSRKPVVNYSEDLLIQSIDSLKKKGLVSTVVGGGSRVIKYKHNLAIKYPLVPSEVVVLALLFLKGPLTAGEINNSAGRMYEFESLDEVQQTLNKLAEDPVGYIKLLPKKAGQKESRYIHLFSEFNAEDYEQPLAPSAETQASLLDLQQEVQHLKTELQQLRDEVKEVLALLQ